MFNKRITVLMGHYGSGKTNVAVNYAIALKNKGNAVSIYDLDIVNPYFRTVDAKNSLDKAGVGLIVSPFAETNVDIPAMNAASYKMLVDKSERAVLDIGGDDRGALALGRFRDGILRENNYSALFVCNPYRPETRDLDGAAAIMEEIERASKIPFTGIVNNANLGEETTAENVLYGLKFASDLAKLKGIELAFTAVKKELITGEVARIDKLLPVELIKYGNWI